MLPGVVASTSTTRGRHVVQSAPARTSASAPSTSIFRKSIVRIPCSATRLARERIGRLSVVTLPPSSIAVRAFSANVVESPCSRSTT